ncbi:MAG: arginine--tRNA ligase [Bacteroidia bacterium]
MNIETILTEEIKKAIAVLYNQEADPAHISFQRTRKEFEGDFTIVVFPFVKVAKKTPEQTAEDIGSALKKSCDLVSGYNVVKGFLNIMISDVYWLNFLNETLSQAHYGFKAADENSRQVMLEYSSPNTNKPLHLGHVRNNLLGHAVGELLKANGNQLIKTSLVNDRGIHICKSMLAWEKFGNGETPESCGMKGDHLVGKYYVEFDKRYKKQIEELIASGMAKEEADKKAPLMQEIQEMLRKWEAGDEETIALWKKMNAWVYKGFDETYKTLGVEFDTFYYESNTYLLGKEMIEEGLKKNVFYRKEDGSVWIDLTGDGLDHKLVLRSDGTSVYMTQDLGTAIERFKEYPKLNQLIYTVGNEQDYHFKVLFLILKKLGYPWAHELFHLSYGMVELPEGKMKSREGTVVDADELLKEMFDTAEQTTKELGKIEGFSEEEAKQLYRTIGLGALKYFILKVDPKKKMLFDPKESVDFNGNTGPFIQYTHARICSVLRKANYLAASAPVVATMQDKEKELIRIIYEFPKTVEESGRMFNPGIVANYVYELVKSYNQFYHDITILKEENADVRNFRLALSYQCCAVIKNGMGLLGIEVPERM